MDRNTAYSLLRTIHQEFASGKTRFWQARQRYRGRGGRCLQYGDWFVSTGSAVEDLCVGRKGKGPFLNDLLETRVDAVSCFLLDSKAVEEHFDGCFLHPVRSFRASELIGLLWGSWDKYTYVRHDRHSYRPTSII